MLSSKPAWQWPVDRTINLTGTDWHTTGDLQATEAKAQVRPARDRTSGLSAEAWFPSASLRAGSRPPSARSE
ncbi:MAG: hypothetical protein WCD47_10340 [Candidatus Sulfotelmatobacter sp.]